MKPIYTAALLLITAMAGAQIVNIPDANFKLRLILNGYDTNGDNEIQVSEAQAVTGVVNFNQSSFADMTGIEAFTNIEYLYCEQNSNITSVSLSNMPNLKAVHLGETLNLQTLTLTNLTGLDTLKCNNSKLTGTLDLTGAPSLKSVNASYNFLTSLNVSASNGLKQLLYANNSIPYANLQLPVTNVIEEVDCSANGLTSSAELLVYSNLKKLNCGSNAMASFFLTNLVQLEELYAWNNQMASFVLTDGGNLKRLEIPGNPLITGTLDLTPYPNLEYANVGATHLTGLNVTGLTNLVYLTCALDDLTTLDVSTLTNLEVLSCAGNDLTSVDVSNLTNLRELSCYNEFMTTLNLSNTPSLKILDCQASQLSSLDLTGCPNLEQLNCGNNPINTLDLSVVPNLYALNCWQNGLTTLDVSMLPNLSVLNCHDNLLTTLDCSNNPLLGFLDIYANPIETLFIKNGAQQYFNDPGNFIENPDLTYICADEDEIAYLLAKPGMNASVNTYCSLPPGGDYNTVTGTVRFDAGNNGCDTSDFAIPFQKIDVTDSQGNGSVFSGQNGVYSFYTADAGCTVWPNFENPSYFQTFLPVNVNFPSANSNVVQDFCVVANGVHQDLEIVIAPIVPARPGFEAVYKVVIRNKGNQVMSMPSGFSFQYNADLMSFIQASTAPASQGPGLIHWDYNNLQPFESRSVEVVMQINAPTHPTHPVNVNDELIFTAVIEAMGGDEMPDDNAFQFHQIVIGSFDPNNMICIEGDIEPVENIGGYLHYIANFENTGTDVAQKIVVKTVFNVAEFDVNSLRVLESSDEVDVRVSGNTAEYIFNGINLAIGGHGNILLKIKTRNDLVNGDMVANRADIYFDYNLPITTNDAETTFQLLSVGHPDIDASIAIYPNPTSDVVTISASANIQIVQLYDVQGRLLQTAMRNEPSVSIDISGKQNGVYFLKVISDKGTSIQKVVKK